MQGQVEVTVPSWLADGAADDGGTIAIGLVLPQSGGRTISQDKMKTYHRPNGDEDGHQPIVGTGLRPETHDALMPDTN